MRIRPGSCASLSMAYLVPACFTMLTWISSSLASPWSEGLPLVFQRHGGLESGRFRRKFVCAKPATALRCRQLPARGGSYATDPVVDWNFLSFGMLGECRAGTTNRQDGYSSGGI